MKKFAFGTLCVAALALSLGGCAKDKATTCEGGACSGEAACSDASAASCSKASECCKAKAAGAANETAH